MAETKVTKMEEIYLKAMTKSCFNDNGDDYKTFGVYCFSVTDEITEYTIQQAKGVLSSLVKKGLVKVMDSEGKGNSEDMIVTMTNKGVEVLGDMS